MCHTVVLSIKQLDAAANVDMPSASNCRLILLSIRDVAGQASPGSWIPQVG